jgi:hypothetical protein
VSRDFYPAAGCVIFLIRCAWPCRQGRRLIPVLQLLGHHLRLYHVATQTAPHKNHPPQQQQQQPNQLPATNAALSAPSRYALLPVAAVVSSVAAPAALDGSERCSAVARGNMALECLFIVIIMMAVTMMITMMTTDVWFSAFQRVVVDALPGFTNAGIQINIAIHTSHVTHHTSHVTRLALCSSFVLLVPVIRLPLPPPAPPSHPRSNGGRIFCQWLQSHSPLPT